MPSANTSGYRRTGLASGPGSSVKEYESTVDPGIKLATSKSLENINGMIFKICYG